MPAKSTKSAAASRVEKLAEREGDGTRTGSKAAKAAEKPAAKAADKPKPGPSRETLIQAAKLRAEGATWDAIRTATGCRLGSSGWFKHWVREGIEHIPAGQRIKPKAEPAAEAAKPVPAKPKRTVKRSGKDLGSRTTDGKKAPVTTRKATAAERKRPAA